MLAVKVVAAQIANKSAFLRQKAPRLSRKTTFTSSNSSTWQQQQQQPLRRTRQMSSAAAAAAQGATQAPPLPLLPTDAQPQYAFGPWPIGAAEVFARTELSYAFVNLKPLVPGHVLVSPLRPAPRLADLTPAEVADMFLLAQAAAARLERHYKAAAATVAVQDGAAAGQTVPHVHVHVLPRRPGDFEPNDRVYDDLEAGEKAMAGDLAARDGDSNGNGGAKPAADHLNLDVERKPRTRAEMAVEAAELRALFPVDAGAL